MATLAMKEAILGVLKSRDLEGDEVIHSSDFTQALEGLGFPMGSPVVEDILVSCKVDSQGNVDFSSFEKDIIRERRVVNSLPPPNKRPPTSTGAAPKPWRADVVHQNKLLSETQAKLVQEHRSELNDAFLQYTNDKTTSEQFVRYIESLGLVATRELHFLLRQNISKELSFVQFIRALVHYDSNSKKDLDPGYAAGGKASSSSDGGGGNERIRVDWSKRKEQIEQSTETVNHGRRMVVDSKGFYKSSANVQECIFRMGGTPSPKPAGGSGGNGSNANDGGGVRFNSEQRVIREQVLAALRKLDSGAISMSEFQNKVYAMGIELPEVVVTLVERSRLSGRLDLRKCIQLLDGSVFKAMVEDQRVDPAVVARLMEKYRAALNRSGVSSLAELARLFHDSDLDGNGVISFGEFKKLCKDYGLTGAGANGGLTDDELRTVFLHVDTDGSGSIDFREFKESIRGEINPKRRNIIHLAFKRVDRHGTGAAEWDCFVDCFNAAVHPDVASGVTTPERLLETLRREYTEEKQGGQLILTYAAFVDMFTDISAMIADDERFIDLVRNSFMLDPSGKAPAAPEYMTCRLSASAIKTMDSSVRKPIARQGHGDCITWMQEESALEKAANAKRATPIRKVQKNRTESSIPLDQSVAHDAALYAKAASEELKMDGGGLGRVQGSRDCSRSSLQSVLSWSDGKRTPQAPATAASAAATTGSGAGSSGGGAGGSPENSARYSNTNTSSIHQPDMYDTGNSVYAGNKYRSSEHDGFSHKISRWSDFKLREYGSGEAPFGTSPSTTAPAPGASTSGGGGKVKSLAELMKDRQTQQ